MTPKIPKGPQAAARLQQALEQHQDLTCEQARDLIPALVEAELAGEDVDGAPAYQMLLRHLDQCEECATYYAELAEDLSALVGAPETLPADQPPARTFFEPVRQSEHVILRVLRSVVRNFELVLQVPRMTPTVVTLGSGSRTALFTDSLPEVPGTPLVSVALSVEESAAELVVAIAEPAATSRWQVRVTIEHAEYTAVTDERGIARFSELPETSLHEITVNCRELPAED